MYTEQASLRASRARNDAYEMQFEQMQARSVFTLNALATISLLPFDQLLLGKLIKYCTHQTGKAAKRQ